MVYTKGNYAARLTVFYFFVTVIYKSQVSRSTVSDSEEFEGIQAKQRSHFQERQIQGRTCQGI